MDDVSILFFDIIPPGNIPGFNRNMPISGFPFWGEYTFLDFALSNTGAIEKQKRYIFCHNEFVKTVSLQTARWSALSFDFFSLNPEISEFIDYISKIESKNIILYNLSFPAIIDPEELRNIKGKRVLRKLSIGNIPVDIFFLSKKNLVDLLHENQYKFTNNLFDYEIFFSEIIHTNFDEIFNMDGKVLFHNNIDQIINENRKILPGKNEYGDILELLQVPPLREKDSVITEKGIVKDSIIFSGTRIEGLIENSVIFPGVHVDEGASVRDSVVMSNNHIGKKTVINNALIFPFFNEIPVLSNIGTQSLIGSKKSLVKNRRFPDQLKNGLTLLGSNSTIPGKTVIEAGCYLDSNIPSGILKKNRIIKKGSSILCDLNEKQYDT